MSSIVSAITGGGSGSSGNAGMNFSAQPSPNMITPVTKSQLDQQYTNTQTGLDQQNAFLRAVQAQNGLGNQANVFGQMQGVANGTGPNPAQAQLAQATGANVSNQAAMMAGQRGAGSNVGMMSRQAAQQGANTQQQSAGQAATLQAQQSLGALNQMGGIATNQANQQANATNAYSNAALGSQQNMLGAAGAFNNANVGMQSNINSTNAGISGVTAQGQNQMMGNMMGGIGSAFQMIPSMFGSSGGSGDFVTSATQAAGGYAEGGNVEKLEPSAWENIKSAFDEKKPNPTPTPVQGLDPEKAKAFIKGGHFADGGEITPIEQSEGATSGPQSNVGKSFMESQDALGAYNPSATMAVAPQGKAPAASGGGPGLPDLGKIINMGQMGKNISDAWSGVSDFFSDAGAGLSSGLGSFATGAGTMMAGGAGEGVGIGGAAELGGEAAVAVAAKGGRVPALVSPGEQYLPPDDVEKVVKEGKNPLKEGERIPGKPKVKGNSYKNDTVAKELEAGGIVIPNSVMQSKHPQWAAHKFVAAHCKEQALKKGK